MPGLLVLLSPTVASELEYQNKTFNFLF